MPLVRSTLFNLFYVLWTAAVSIGGLPILLFGRQPQIQGVARLWLRGFLGAARWVLGITWEVEGREHLPDGQAIIAAKHQSAFETFLFHHLVTDPAYVLKKELLSLPLVGQYMKASGQIAVDRSAGAQALKFMVRDARAALDRGATLVIFPEGTRVPLGETRPYQPGVAALYTQMGVPVVPIALNSGLVWPRNSYLKRPGRVVLRVLPPIPPGLTRRAFLATLQQQIEEASRALAERDPDPDPDLGPVGGPPLVADGLAQGAAKEPTPAGTAVSAPAATPSSAEAVCAAPKAG